MKTNNVSRYDYYKASVSFCEALWEQLMRDDAHDLMGREGWETLRAAYDVARDEQTRRFNAWIGESDEIRKKAERILAA